MLTAIGSIIWSPTFLGAFLIAFNNFSISLGVMGKGAGGELSQNKNKNEMEKEEGPIE